MAFLFRALTLGFLFCGGAVLPAQEVVTLKSIEIRNVWIRANTHLEPAWWEKGTEWEGVPAFTTYAQIKTRGLANKKINVDIEFRDEKGQLLRRQPKAPGFCRGNDGFLRPAWHDQIPGDPFEYVAFRIPVPYLAMFADGRPAGNFVVSARAYCEGISSRMERKISLPSGDGWGDEPLIELDRTKASIGERALDFQHDSRTREFDPIPELEHSQPGLNITQEISCAGELPRDYRCFIQLGQATYHGGRSFVEDIVLQREHYLPLVLQQNVNYKTQLQRIGQPGRDFLVAEPAMNAADEKYRWVATAHFESQAIQKLAGDGSPKLKPMVLTVSATHGGKSVYRQRMIEIDLQGDSNRPRDSEAVLKGNVDRARVKPLSDRGYRITGTTIEFRPNDLSISPREMEIRIAKDADVSTYKISFIGKVSKTSENRWVGRCEYFRVKTAAGTTTTSDRLTSGWTIRKSAAGEYLMDLPGVDYRFD